MEQIVVCEKLNNFLLWTTKQKQKKNFWEPCKREPREWAHNSNLWFRNSKNPETVKLVHQNKQKNLPALHMSRILLLGCINPEMCGQRKVSSKLKEISRAILLTLKWLKFLQPSCSSIIIIITAALFQSSFFSS
jgi:hypothetical protein